MSKAFKQLLSESWLLEKRLIRLCESCVMRLYPDDQDVAISYFRSIVEDGNFFHSIRDIDHLDNLMQNYKGLNQECERRSVKMEDEVNSDS